MIHKLINKYNNLKKKYPNISEDLIMMIFDKMEDIAYQILEEYEIEKEYGCHIGTEEFYDKAVSLLKWVDDKGSGPRWSVNEIIKSSNIDFGRKDYYEYDYAYVVNMLYSDNCNVSELTNSAYLKMAKNYLEDPDYMGEPDERAYKNAVKRIEYARKD